MTAYPGFSAPTGLDDRWMADAACRGHDPRVFFPTSSRDTGAKAICAGCPVCVDCLEYALASGCDTAGIWSGTSEHERDRIRTARARRKRTA